MLIVIIITTTPIDQQSAFINETGGHGADTTPDRATHLNGSVTRLTRTSKLTLPVRSNLLVTEWSGSLRATQAQR